MHAAFLDTDNAESWRDAESLPVGTVMRNPIVAAQIGITMQNGSMLRADVHDRDGTCFTEPFCLDLGSGRREAG